MKLNLDSALIQTPVAGPAATASARSSTAGRTVESGSGDDSVGVSGASKALYRFASDRAVRIESLARSVANGTYAASAENIGKAILQQAGG